ncbi:MAG: S8 family serine peptidase [Desulfobacteraceae bacterium]|nr:S8 family serine peptidase [Desulfobacteraceae bacterium]
MKFRNLVILLAVIAISIPAWAGPMGPHMERMVKMGKGNFAGGKFARTFERAVQGKAEVFAHLFIDADQASIPVLRALGVEINTVTQSGVMTAVAPVKKLNAIAATAGVRSLSAGHSVKKFMDRSAGPGGVNLPDTAYPRPGNTGSGVIVGVIDTGIDVEHPDFIDSGGNTRIIAIWDHTLDPVDVGGAASNPAGFTYGTEWPRTLIQQGYSSCLHRDKDGHGTHVAGTAAGNGSGASYGGPYVGLAPGAELLIVKFDFDNEKDRNTDTAILDSINWIYQKAAAEGKPCVINMSLGSDYGPHDGSTAEERGIDDLTGENKIICISAGNGGRSYDGVAFNTWGGPIHGSGNMNTNYDIVLATSPDYTPDDPGDPDDYIFFSAWYSGSDKCRVQITTPSGVKYPPNFKGQYNRLWKTDGIQGGISTPEGTIYVENMAGDGTFWETDNGDNSLYVEISDYFDVNPSPGDWVIEIIPIKGNGGYHAWHGHSESMRKSYFWYDSGTANHTWGDYSDPSLSDNLMTIGKPATAFSAISVGAYQTKAVWPARKYDDWTDPNSYYSLIWMEYGVYPIDYYDPYYMHDIAFFSSRGPSRDGRIQPFISAPGVGIVASLSQTALNDPDEEYFRFMNRVEYNGYYCTLQGTSMSSPHATGSLALLLEEAMNKGLSPTPDDVRSYLKLGANHDPYTGLDPNDAEDRNNDWGYGKIDVTESLLTIGQLPPAPEVTGCVPDSGSQGQRLTVTVSGQNFQTGASVSFGDGITVRFTTVKSSSEIDCSIRINKKAAFGVRDVVVTNPNSQSGALVDGFEVTN